MRLGAYLSIQVRTAMTPSKTGWRRLKRAGGTQGQRREREGGEGTGRYTKAYCTFWQL